MAGDLLELAKLKTQIEGDVGSPVQVQLQFGKPGRALSVSVGEDAVRTKSGAELSDYEFRVATSAYEHAPRRWSLIAVTVGIVRVSQLGPITFTKTSNVRTWGAAALDLDLARARQSIFGNELSASPIHGVNAGSDTGSHLPSNLFARPRGGSPLPPHQQ